MSEPHDTPRTELASHAGRGPSAVSDLRLVAALFDGLLMLSSGRVLDDVLRALRSTAVLGEVAALVIDAAIAVSGAERGFILLTNTSGTLDLKMARTRDLTEPKRSFDQHIAEEVFRTGKTRIEAARFDGEPPTSTVSSEPRHVLCAPLQLSRSTAGKNDPSSAEKRRIGVLLLDSRANDDRQQLSSTAAAIETLADEAAVAIQAADRYGRMVQQHTELELEMTAEQARRFDRLSLRMFEKMLLEREIRAASLIQQTLLSRRHHTGAFFDAAAATLPCRSIAGDFFEYIDLPDGALGFALGDVAGKGPPAALLSALMQGSLAAQARASVGSAATVAALNTMMVHRGIQGRFVTLFYGLLYPNGRLTYCNAGHNAPMLVRAGANVARLETGGMVVGLFDGVPFTEGSVVLQPEDYLVVYSDGVSEAMNDEEEEFGDDRLLDCVARMPEEPEATTEYRLQHILANVEQFTDGAQQHDDVTVMVVVYQPTA